MHERNIAHRCGLAHLVEALSQTILGLALRGSSCAIRQKRVLMDQIEPNLTKAGISESVLSHILRSDYPTVIT